MRRAGGVQSPPAHGGVLTLGACDMAALTAALVLLHPRLPDAWLFLAARHRVSAPSSPPTTAPSRAHG